MFLAKDEVDDLVAWLLGLLPILAMVHSMYASLGFITEDSFV